MIAAILDRHWPNEMEVKEAGRAAVDALGGCIVSRCSCAAAVAHCTVGKMASELMQCDNEVRGGGGTARENGGGVMFKRQGLWPLHNFQMSFLRVLVSTGRRRSHISNSSSTTNKF